MDEEPETESRILRGPERETEREDETALEIGMFGVAVTGGVYVDVEAVEKEGEGREEKSCG